MISTVASSLRKGNRLKASECIFMLWFIDERTPPWTRDLGQLLFRGGVQVFIAIIYERWNHHQPLRFLVTAHRHQNQATRHKSFFIKQVVEETAAPLIGNGGLLYCLELWHHKSPPRSRIAERYQSVDFSLSLPFLMKPNCRTYGFFLPYMG